MKKNTNFLQSFKNAATGIVSVFINERNMRFHFMIANLISVFAVFFGLSGIEWAVLMIAICFVFVSEIINTAVENAVNTATEEFSVYAKTAKDASAGAVLVAAIFSLITGVCLFFDPERIYGTLKLIFTSPRYLIPCLILGIFDILFLISGGNTPLNERKKK